MIFLILVIAISVQIFLTVKKVSPFLSLLFVAILKTHTLLFLKMTQTTIRESC